MLDPSLYPFCSEFYVVEKSIEVVVTLKSTGTAEEIRIDALSGTNPNVPYNTHAYIKKEITVQPKYPETSANPESIRVWVDYDLPWTNRNSADDALAQALGFLRDRCQ
jgi:hypothetical protein